MHLPKEPGRFQKPCVKRVALLPWLDPNRRLALLAQHLRVFSCKHLKVTSRRQGRCRTRGTAHAKEHSENKREITSLSKERSTAMTTLQAKGDWNIAKGKLKQKWATLTDDDLQCAEGKHDEMLGRIQKRTGETLEAVEKAVKEASSCCCK
jgi:uncharacterized protein YjbJ (UPF0337 family)